MVRTCCCFFQPIIKFYSCCQGIRTSISPPYSTILSNNVNYFPGEVSTQEDCSYQSVLNYLNLTRINEMFTATRPVTDWTHPTVVNLDVYLYVILAVVRELLFLARSALSVSPDTAALCSILITLKHGFLITQKHGVLTTLK